MKLGQTFTDFRKDFHDVSLPVAPEAVSGMDYTLNDVFPKLQMAEMGLSQTFRWPGKQKKKLDENDMVEQKESFGNNPQPQGPQAWPRFDLVAMNHDHS